jgi:hypothetical protein
MNAVAVSWMGYACMLSEAILALLRRSRRSEGRSADRGSLLLLWVVIVMSITLVYSLSYTEPAGAMSGALSAWSQVFFD